MRYRRNVGRAFGLVFMASLSFALIGVITKILTQHLPSNEIVFFRSAFNLILILGLLLSHGEDLFPKGRGILLFRGLAGFVGFICYVYSVAHLPVSIAALITWLSPLFVMTIGRIFLKEPVPLKNIAAFIAAMVGLSLLVFPGGLSWDATLPLAAIGIAVLGTLAGAIAHVAVRAATRDFDAFMIVFYFSLPATIFSLPLAMVQGWVWPQGWQWAGLAAIGVLGTVAQVTITRAYAYLEAGPVSLMSLMSALMVVGLSAWVIGESLVGLQWVGMVVLGGAVALVLRKS